MIVVRVQSYRTESSQDIAMARAIVEHTPYWPQWERLSDAASLIRIATNTKEKHT